MTPLPQQLRRIQPEHVIKTASALALLYVLIRSYQLYQIDSALILTTPPAMLIFAIAGVAFAWYLTSIKHPTAWLAALLAIVAAALV